MSAPDDTAPAGRVPPGLDSPPSQDERTWGMLSHLSAFVGLVIPFFGAILAPLIIWLAWRDRSPFVGEQAKEALNFNISVAIGWLVCGLLTVVFIGFLLGIGLFFAWLALTILAAIRASEGVQYRYPLNLRLVR
ncbi:MAG TPA: DUF4870 domain-containing protein [Steroidobacteraceae bacterium]|nr:DUF4870 domain-containing protein [Steroidobacteraceae bacterium]